MLLKNNGEGLWYNTQEKCGMIVVCYSRRMWKGRSVLLKKNVEGL